MCPRRTPSPPWICTALSMTSLRALGGEQLGHRGLAGDARRAHVLRPGGAVDEQRRRIDVERHLGDAAPAPFAGRTSGAPNNRRSRARLSASSSARRAKPSAAAPTVVRKTSSVAMAILKAFAWRADHRGRGDARILEPDARERMRRDHLDALGDGKARDVAGTIKAEIPFAPGASPVRAKTT